MTFSKVKHDWPRAGPFAGPARLGSLLELARAGHSCAALGLGPQRLHGPASLASLWLCGATGGVLASQASVAPAGGPPTARDRLLQAACRSSLSSRSLRSHTHLLDPFISSRAVHTGEHW